MKNLIVYFSRNGENIVNGEVKTLITGNTEIAANFIRELLDEADLFKIEALEPYSFSYEEVSKRSKDEFESNARPELKNYLESIDEYENIFVGYPNWWGTCPMPIFSFLEHYSFSGKNIYPFCTNEGSGLGLSDIMIGKVCKDAVMKKGLTLVGSRINDSKPLIAEWLSALTTKKELRRDFGPKTWLVPLPVLIIGTYDKFENANAMNAAWGGINDYNQVFISLSEHKTTDNLRETGAFTVSFATKKTMEASDYVGIVSYNKEPNKLEIAGLHAQKSKNINAPIFDEYPLTLECKVSLFDEDSTGVRVVGDIVNVTVKEDIITNGVIDMSKLEPISFNPIDNSYYVIGEKVGDAFKVGLNKK